MFLKKLLAEIDDYLGAMFNIFVILSIIGIVLTALVQLLR